MDTITSEVLDAIIDGYKAGIVSQPVSDEGDQLLSVVNRIAIAYVGLDRATILFEGAAEELRQESNSSLDRQTTVW